MKKKTNGRGRLLWLPAAFTMGYFARGILTTCGKKNPLGSEKMMTDHLKEAGIAVKSVKFGKVQYPRNSTARRCDTILENFIVGMIEEKSASYYQESLRKYCGVHIEL